MDNKILILLMSCNKPLYEEEEQACRDTFLKDAEKAGIQYYFYKGTNEEHPEQFIDVDNNTMYLQAPDGLAGTSTKTALAFGEALKMDDWDYVIKTNVSTWLDIQRIVKAVSAWEGREDRNIYGARFLVNDASRKVPFPRGHFMILSRALVGGVVALAPKLLGAEGLPKTDDTLMCLSLLYFVQKVLGDNYRSRLFEVPSVVSWTDDIQEAVGWADSLSVRCKDEATPTDTPDNMRKTHKLKRSKNQKRTYRRPVNLMETKFGLMPYEAYEKASIILENMRKNTDGYKGQNGTVKRTDPEDRLEKIREKLRKI